MARTAEEALKWDRHIAYSRGMHDGAGRKSMRPEYTEHVRADLRSTYERAYVLGQEITDAAIKAHAREIGYVPNVLRVQEESTFSATCSKGHRVAVRGGPCTMCLDGMPLTPHNMAVPDGPVCGGCGLPSHHESGWCGDPTCELVPRG